MRSKASLKRKLLVMGTLVVLVAGLLAYLKYDRSDSTLTKTHAQLSDNAEQTNQFSSEQKSKTRINSNTDVVSEEDEFLSQQLKEELGWVAQAYEQQAKYPLTSRLVQDASLARSPKPFEEAKVDLQLPDEDGNLSPINLSASVDKIQYFMGETIAVRLLISGTEGNESISANANLKKLGAADLLPANVALSDFDGNQSAFQTTINTSILNLPPSSHELVAKIMVQIDEKDYVTTVPFIFSQASAQLENVALSQPEGAFLNIPLEYSVFEAGYYFVSAYLDDAASGRPLLELQTEGLMNQGNQRLVLRAHHQALKDAGSQGPYFLRVMRSYRGGKPGEGNDVPTAISQRAYAIPAFAFENYDDIPYSDPEVEERLEALRSLSGD